MQEKIPASLEILTKNSGKTLARALESAKDFDDILIIDGGSTDETLEIARKYKAHILQQDMQFLDEHGKIFDYAGVRNQGLTAAKHNWFFVLDSDEYIGKDLTVAVRKIISERGENGSGAFWVNRIYVLDDVPIDHASTYPNRQMRFFARNSAAEFIKRVHERIQLKPEVKAEALGGKMFVPFVYDLPAIRKKWDYQIAVAAAQASPMSIWTFIEAVFHSMKASLLWGSRLIYQQLFCKGTHMPIDFELERHYFHLRLIRALWRVVKL
jgi:glycosyltransferase involved in cell wall biosynthesis